MRRPELIFIALIFAAPGPAVEPKAGELPARFNGEWEVTVFTDGEEGFEGRSEEGRLTLAGGQVDWDMLPGIYWKPGTGTLRATPGKGDSVTLELVFRGKAYQGLYAFVPGEKGKADALRIAFGEPGKPAPKAIPSLDKLTELPDDVALAYTLSRPTEPRPELANIDRDAKAKEIVERLKSSIDLKDPEAALELTAMPFFFETLWDEDRAREFSTRFGGIAAYPNNFKGKYKIESVTTFDKVGDRLRKMNSPRVMKRIGLALTPNHRVVIVALNDGEHTIRVIVGVRFQRGDAKIVALEALPE